MSLDLHEQASSVDDWKSLLEFARVLRADKEDEGRKERLNPSPPYGPGLNGWENQTIEDFLDAAIRWAESTSFGETQGLSSTNPWAQFAAFLYCGKIYE
jgi:hypothetical protein